jgi:hypothetical protein
MMRLEGPRTSRRSIQRRVETQQHSRSSVAIEFDLNGRKVAFDQAVVRTLRAKARAQAGSSTALNDLAVLLDRALVDGKAVTLRHARHCAPSDEF